jgi:hypothetical protein
LRWPLREVNSPDPNEQGTLRVLVAHAVSFSPDDLGGTDTVAGTAAGFWQLISAVPAGAVLSRGTSLSTDVGGSQRVPLTAPPTELDGSEVRVPRRARVLLSITVIGGSSDRDALTRWNKGPAS